MPKEDITGQKFGELKTIHKITNGRYLCKCNCGNIVEIKRNRIITGHVKSCGCLINGIAKDNNVIGKKFNEITILDFSHGRNERRYYNCECSCGYKYQIGYDAIGKTKACMKCSNFKGYKELYGWYWTQIQKSAEIRDLEFDITIEYAWDLFLKQDKKCALTGRDLIFSYHKDKSTASLDRIDNTRGYIKGNVQWLHKEINILKNTWSDDELINICKEIILWKS